MRSLYLYFCQCSVSIGLNSQIPMDVLVINSLIHFKLHAQHQASLSSVAQTGLCLHVNWIRPAFCLSFPLSIAVNFS